MARIRTIKPEFPQSESMGRVSRDSRLLFIQLWTLADDVGRLRGNSRILASLLYPYDDDSLKHIDIWISELEREGCIVRYVVDGSTYVQVLQWARHQKIDKPSASKLPAFVEPSRLTREASRGVVGGSGSGSGPGPGPGPGKDISLRPKQDTDAHFETIKAVYPKFTGRHDWIAAEHHCHQRIERDGQTWEDLIFAAERYRHFCDHGGVSSEQYVLAPAKFFSAADKPWAQSWKPPKGKAETRLEKNLDAAEIFMRETEPKIETH